MSERKNNRESQNRSRNQQGNAGGNRRGNSGQRNMGPNQNGPYNDPYNGPNNGPYNGPNQNGPYRGPNQMDPYNGQYQNDPYNNGGYQNAPYNNQYQNAPYNGQGGPYQGGGNGRRGRNQNPNAMYDGSYPNGGPKGKRNKSSKRKVRRRVIFAIEIIVLLVLALGLFVWAKMSKVSREDIPKGDIVINSEMSSEQTKVLQGYQNIALFGVDSREGLTKDALSDTIMIASINKDTKDIKLVSVYRDTYLDNTNGEYRKATECYLKGGPQRSINMLNKNLDLDITDFVTVNFNVVAEVVKELGGVEINVEADEIVHLNNYQVEGSEVTGMPIVQVTDTGMQTLNGLQALSYCRIRYTAGNDYKRTERQRTVLEQIMKKAKTTNILKLTGMIDALLPKAATSLSNTEILGLAKDLASYNISETTGFPFDLLAANIAAGDCVVPVNLANNVTQLHKYLFNSENYTPSASVQKISDKIINETGIQ